MSSDLASKLDSYGFDNPDFIDNATYEDFMAHYSQILLRRGKRWKPIMEKESIDKNLKVKRFVRKGIPLDHRSEVWMIMSGAQSRMEANKGVYASLQNKVPDRAILDVIQADVPRTFPENIYFQNSADPRSKLQALRNVLLAFATRNTTVGYCQGLNYVTAVLLMIVKEEEQAFWLLDTLINDILPPYYVPSMTAVQVDCLVLDELLKLKMPAVHQVIHNSGTTCTLFATKWFICLFADVLPIETVMRILDCVFYEGDKILFRAALTLVKQNADRITGCDKFPEVVTTFRNMARDRATLFCHEFIQNMFKLPGSLSRRKLRDMRARYTKEVEAKSNSNREGENGTHSQN